MHHNQVVLGHTATLQCYYSDRWDSKIYIYYHLFIHCSLLLNPFSIWEKFSFRKVIWMCECDSQWYFSYIWSAVFISLSQWLIAWVKSHQGMVTHTINESIQVDTFSCLTRQALVTWDHFQIRNPLKRCQLRWSINFYNSYYAEDIFFHHNHATTKS